MKKNITLALTACTLLSASSIYAQPGVYPPRHVEPRFAAPSHAQQDYFSGFYIGVTGGMRIMPSIDYDTNVIVSNTLFTPYNPVYFHGHEIPFPYYGYGYTIIPAGDYGFSQASGGSSAGYSGFQTGVGKVFGRRQYLGLVGFGKLGQISDAGTLNVNPTVNPIYYYSDRSQNIFDFVQTQTNSVVSNTTVQIGNDYGAAGKVGFLITPRTMLYGTLGAAFADIKISNDTEIKSSVTRTRTASSGDGYMVNISSDATGSSSNEENKAGLHVGVGLEQFIYSHFISVNIEYAYENFGKVETTSWMATDVNFSAKSTSSPPVSYPVYDYPLAVTVRSSAIVEVSTVSAGLNFYFGGRNF